MYGGALDGIWGSLAYDKQINIGDRRAGNFYIFNPFFRDTIKGDNDGSKWGLCTETSILKKRFKNGIRDL